MNWKEPCFTKPTQMTDPLQTRKILAFGFLGIAATLTVGVGEFLIHYSPSGYAAVDNFQWLKTANSQHVIVGHYLMLIGLPLYIAGYYHIYLGIRVGNETLAKLILAIGIFAFMTGGVWAGSRAMLTEIVKSENQLLLNYYKQHYEVLVNVLRIIIFLISVCWVTALVGTKTMYPKWMAFFNPIMILGLVFLTYLLIPGIGKFLVPTAMNVTHFIFFSFSILMIYNQRTHENRS